MLSDRILNLLEDNIDLAVRIGILPDSSLIATRIGSTRRVVCASPAYLAARGRPGRPDDVSGHDCIAFESLASPRAWTFTIGKSERAVPIHARLTVTTAEAAIDAAVAGLGMTRVLSYMIEGARRAGELEIVLDEVRTRTLARQSCLSGERARAPQAPRLPRLGDTSPQDADDWSMIPKRCRLFG